MSFKGLNIGVSGLKSQSRKMEVIGHNLANINTAGYKRSIVRFAELYSDILKQASGGDGNNIGGTNPMEVGMGVGISAIHKVFSQGARMNTGRALDFQISGWFYTLMVLSTLLFDKPPYKNVIVNGTLLTEKGHKMSKSLKNYPDPELVIKQYGADAIRLYMLHSPAVKGDDLSFSEKGVELVLRQVMIPMWNAYSFFITYARIYKWAPEESWSDFKPQAEIDRWMLSTLQKLVADVEKGLDDYDLSRAVDPFVGFVDQLTNWYIRRSRRRFWTEEDSQDRREAFQTLYIVLVELSKVAAPFIPFITDAMYRNLRSESMVDSVHLCDYPAYRESWRDEALERTMAAVQTTVSQGHSLRKEHKVKVRQPLPCVHVACGMPELLDSLKDQHQLIAEELNVKDVQFHANEEQFVFLKTKPNFRVLGRKVGKFMKAVQQTMAQFDRQQSQTLLDGGELVIDLEGTPLTLTSEDVEVQREIKEGLAAANEGTLTIVLDTSLNDELLIEGLAREVVNKINSMRRDAGFEVTDRIKVSMETTDRVQSCFGQHRDYITGEVLAIDWLFQTEAGSQWDVSQEWDLNGEPATISLQRIPQS